MNAAYNSALRDVTSIKTDLARIESRETSPPPDLDARFDALTATLDNYERLAKRELVFSKQQKALARLKDFRREEEELRSRVSAAILAAGSSSPAYAAVSSTAVGGSGSTNNTALHARGMSTLAGNSPSTTSFPQSVPSFQTRTPGQEQATSPYGYGGYGGYTPGSSYVGYGGYGSYANNSDPRAAYKMNASTAAMFGNGSGREAHALREHSFIEQTEAQLDSFISQGREVWENLTEQRHILKGTRRRLLDAANTLGLSRKVIGYVERRSIQDNIIFGVGAILTLVCFCQSFSPPPVATRSCLLMHLLQTTSTNGLADLSAARCPSDLR